MFERFHEQKKFLQFFVYLLMAANEYFIIVNFVIISVKEIRSIYLTEI